MFRPVRAFRLLAGLIHRFRRSWNPVEVAANSVYEEVLIALAEYRLRIW